MVEPTPDISVIPDGWKISALGDSCDIFSGFAFKSVDFCSTGIPVVKIGNLQNGTIQFNEKTSCFPKEKYNKSLSRFVLKAGDLLIAMTGATTGKVAVVSTKANGALLNQRVGKIELRDQRKIDLDFIRYLILTNTFQREIQEGILKSAQGNISPQNLGRIYITLPPLPEQRAIAQVLRTVQRAKEATEKVIANARQLKESLMQHLFTYGPGPFPEADRVELKETEIGNIPADWRIEPVANVAEVKTSTSPMKALEQAETGFDQVFYLKVSDMNHPLNFRRIVTAAIRFSLSESAVAQLNSVPKGATILPKRGAAIATNKKRLITLPCLLDPNLMAVIPGGDLLSEFLFGWLEQFDLRTITDTATLPQLNKKDIEPLLMPVPPIQEQETISATLEAAEKKVEKEEERKNALESLFTSLLQNLMTGQIRVHELDLPTLKEVA